VIETLHEGVDAAFCEGLHHTGEGRKGLRSSLVVRTVRDVAGDHGGAERPFRALVGRLHPRARREAQ
jgi:hypothetical protein